jgi:hypothetical protein
MKKVTIPPKKNKSLLQKTGSRAESPNMGRKYYLGRFNSLVKGGMSARSAAKAVQKEAADDIKIELDEFFNQ